MINIQEIKDEEIDRFISHYQSLGGCAEITHFKISENYSGELTDDEYLKHLTVARQALEGINYSMNLHLNKLRGKNNSLHLSTWATDHDLLSPSGKEITLEEFLGGYIQSEEMRSALVENSYLANLYEFDPLSNKSKDMQTVYDRHRTKFPDSDSGFAHTFLEPPYSMSLRMTEKGDFFVKALNILYPNLEQMVIYKWSTDCNPYFEAGKEWWGCFFCTVYDPVRDIYMGIVASETD